MNILICTPTFPPFNSGLGNAVQEQVNILTSLGGRVTVATYGAQRQTEFMSDCCIEKFNVSGADCLVNPIKGDIDSYKTFLTDSNFDIIIANAWQTWTTDILLGILDHVRGKKILYSHCISTNLFFWRTPLKSLVRYLLWRPYHHRVKNHLRRLDGLVVLADHGCDSRFDDLKIAKEIGTPVFVIPNALPSTAIHAEEEAISMMDRPQIISVGAYDWLKGHDFVLRAYARSAAKNVIPIKIFGQKFTAYTDRLKILARQLDISEQFLSFHEGVSGALLHREYRLARVFLYGSHTECQPLVLLDAMAAGTPFVSRASGCIDSMPGGVAITEEHAAARQLNILLGDPLEWKARSAAGRSGVRMHTGESVSGKWRSALQAILEWPEIGAVPADTQEDRT